MARNADATLDRPLRRLVGRPSIVAQAGTINIANLTSSIRSMRDVEPKEFNARMSNESDIVPARQVCVCTHACAQRISLPVALRAIDRAYDMQAGTKVRRKLYPSPALDTLATGRPSYHKLYNVLFSCRRFKV